MEQQYLSLLQEISTCDERITRNSTTRSKFGALILAKDIVNNFPLLTTKRIYWKGVVEELLWFLKGNTNACLLQEKGVHIWDGNSTREFLDSRGQQTRQVGDCGPIYGFQWRHYGAKYVDCYTDYSNLGIDQLKECIKTIIEDPTSRRIVMTAYNLEQLPEMSLPPCHVMYQFYVTTDGHLNCFLYQRSGDMFLGVPFNIASTALLTSIIAHYTGLIPGDVRLDICDAHIYSEHLDAVNTQLQRVPTRLPTITINDDNTFVSVDDIMNKIESLTFDKIVLNGYNPQPTIKAPMIA